MPPKPRSPLVIEPFVPQATKPGGEATGTDKEFGDGRFGITGSRLDGLRSPDRIDTPDNVLQITTSVGVQSLSPEDMAALQYQLKQAGLVPDGFQVSGTLDSDTKKALLELKATATSSGMSDLDTLRTRIEQAALMDAATGGTTGPQTTRTISEPVFTDPMTARKVLRDTLSSRLGRAPTADEYHQFRGLLTNAEGGQDITTNTPSVDSKGRAVTTVTRNDDTTDPTADVVADDFSRRGKLGREANTVSAASYFDIIANRVGGQ